MDHMSLPVPVLGSPHWRVLIRPDKYKEQLIGNLGKCYEIIEKSKLSLRGWDYPHLSGRQSERAQGKDWIASWSDFMGHCEYWRLYQSGQFVHLFSVREATEEGVKEKLRNTMKQHLSHQKDVNIDSVPGFISIVNFVYNITEIFEFAARLSQAVPYFEKTNIRIELNKIKGFVLAASFDRIWFEYYSASEDSLDNEWSIENAALLANSKDAALNAIIWYFERFGWLVPPIEVIKQDQENLIKGRY